MKLTGSNNLQLGCIKAGVTNGKTVSVPAIPYVAAGVAAAALILSGFAALGSIGVVGAPAPAVSFSTVIGWFQTMQMNGMHSVNYPPIYRAFSKNFAFSGGLIPWNKMQTSIDDFRARTGGNLTGDSVEYLQNSTLVFNDGSDNNPSNFNFVRRSLSSLFVRDITTSTGDTGSNDPPNKVNDIVYGIGGYVEQLTIPQSNTFMTVLLIFAIVVAGITVAILLLKVILEAWTLFGKFPKRLTSFRKRYWLTLAKVITQLILLLYGVWVLYCIFQFRNGDSWAAKVLAAVTLATFTGILAFFTIKIITVARKARKANGDTSALYDDKKTWIKYSLFYDAYRQGYWWLFMPAIVYMFAKGCVLAAGDGHGLTQTSGLLIVEGLMLILLLWTRPFATRSSQIINIFVQVIRVLSVACILVFVEELGIAQSTKTITGVVLIAVQAGLTGLLAILIAVNAIIMMCRESPHRKKRKEAEKLNRESHNLTPLDPRNSLLDTPAADAKPPTYQFSPFNNKQTGYAPIPNPGATSSSERLVANASEMPRSRETGPYTPNMYSDERNRDTRQPTFPLAGFAMVDPAPAPTARRGHKYRPAQNNQNYAPVATRSNANFSQPLDNNYPSRGQTYSNQNWGGQGSRF